MADPISMMASIIAIGHAGTNLARYSRKLYRISSETGISRIAEDVDFFASHIDLFGSTISSSFLTIRGHFDKHKDSLTIERLGGHEVLSCLALQCKHLIKRLVDVEPRVKPGSTRLSFVGRAQWMMQGTEREELCVWMERVKTTMLMILLQIAIEASPNRVVEKPDPPGNMTDLFEEMRSEQRRMRKQLKGLVKTVGVLSERDERLRNRVSRDFEIGHSVEIDRVVEGVVEVSRSVIRSMERGREQQQGREQQRGRGQQRALGRERGLNRTMRSHIIGGQFRQG